MKPFFIILFSIPFLSFIFYGVINTIRIFKKQKRNKIKELAEIFGEYGKIIEVCDITIHEKFNHFWTDTFQKKGLSIRYDVSETDGFTKLGDPRVQMHGNLFYVDKIIKL